MDVAAFAALGVFAAMALAIFALERREGPSQRRSAAIGERYREGRIPQVRRGIDSGLDNFVRCFMPKPVRLRQKLLQTGRGYGIGSFAATTALTAAVAVMIFLLCGLSIFAALPLGFIFGAPLPNTVVGMMVRGRRKRFTALFPEAIGLIVRGLKSGLPASESMAVIGRELAAPVGDEFRQIADDMRLGSAMEKAIADAAKRIGTVEFDFFLIALNIQRETGGNLAETLQNLDEVLRRRRQMRLKVKAMSSEARASAAIIASMPFVMIAILFAVNPDYPKLLFTTGLGRALIGGAMTNVVIGFCVIGKMIRFEV